MNETNFDPGEWIPFRDRGPMDVKKDVIEEIKSIRDVYENSGRTPCDEVIIFIWPSKMNEYGIFENKLIEGAVLEESAEEQLEQFLLSLEVKLCDLNHEAPSPVRKGLDIESLSEAKQQYYVHTIRHEVTAARLRCDHGLAHQNTLDIMGRDRVNIGRGREVSPANKTRRRHNDFAFLNPQDPEDEEEKERLGQATEHERASLRVIHRDHAEIVQEGRRYCIYPGHRSYRVLIERSRSTVVVTDEGQILEDEDRILLMPDEKDSQPKECASIDVELEMEQVADFE